MNASDLQKLLPSAKRADVLRFAAPLGAAMDEYNIKTPARIAAFLANVAHESGNLSAVEEGLNYSAKRLREVWPRRFPTDEIAAEYHRQPMKIANFVYANREGNGDAASGDGWRFRGAGLIQLTFRNNHTRAANWFHITPENIGDWLRTPEGAARSAAMFWRGAGCNLIADRGDFDGVCDAINIGRKTEKHGDANGFAHRLELFNHIRKEIA